MNIRDSLAVTTITFSLLTSVAGQQSTSPPPDRQQQDVVSITTNLVQADVIVTDKDGQHVTDLGPEDFEVSEDGKRRQITNFSYVTTGEPPPEATTAGTASPSAAPPAENKKTDAPVTPARLSREKFRRTIALVVDDLGVSWENTASVRQALKKFVNEQMRADDLVAVLRTSSGVGSLQQFTSDKGQLLAAVERVRWYPAGRSGVESFAPARDVSDDFTDGPELTEESERSREGIYAAGTLNGIGSIVNGLRDMPGRKSVLLFSEAFRLFSSEGRNIRLLQALNRLTDQANAAAVTIYTVDAGGLQTLAGTAGDKAGGVTLTFTPGQIASAQAASTPGGVPPAAPPLATARADSLSAQAERDSAAAFRKLNSMMDQRQAQNFESQSVLSYLAQRTGGLFVRNRNDLSRGVEQIMNDQKGFYLIGYRPDDSSVDPKTGRRRFRKLAVKVKRPGLTVRARDGYFGITGEAQTPPRRSREEQLAAALVSPFASGAVALRLTSLFGVEPGGGPFLRALLHVDARSLSFTEEAGGKRKASLEVVAAAFNENGQPVSQDTYPQEVSVAGEEQYQRLLGNGLDYILNFPVSKPGAYQVRAVVRDSASEQIGSASQFVEVPDLNKNRLTLSGVVLSGVGPTAQTDAASGPPAGTKAAETDSNLGPSMRRLRRGVLLDYRYNIHNARLDATGRPQVQTQMRILRDGQPVFTGKTLPLDAGGQRDVKRLNMIGRLRVGPELTPGDYVLQVIVTDLLAPKGQRTAVQWMDFEIVE